MPTHLSFEDHLDAVADAALVLRTAAATAGLGADVPTCPRWDVRDLVLHQGMVHRWATANLTGGDSSSATRFRKEGESHPDLLAWFDEGVADLLTNLRAAPDDLKAMVFLRDAPPPKRFWARRQAHETTIHAADAVAASLGRFPTVDDLTIDPAVAADGIDELLMGFIPRGAGKLAFDTPTRIVVRAEDTGQAWTVDVDGEGTSTSPGDADGADAVMAGPAAELYVGLWNRLDHLTVEGPEQVTATWRKLVRIRWGG